MRDDGLIGQQHCLAYICIAEPRRVPSFIGKAAENEGLEIN